MFTGMDGIDCTITNKNYLMDIVHMRFISWSNNISKQKVHLRINSVLLNRIFYYKV